MEGASNVGVDITVAYGTSPVRALAVTSRDDILLGLTKKLISR